MSVNAAKLIVPHWYGSGDERIARGCRALEQATQLSGMTCVVPVRAPAESVRSIRRYEQVLQSLSAIRKAIEALSPSAVFTLGGDCGIEVPILSYLSRLYGDRFGVVWIDAHADANTPQTSPSGYFHGMPVRCLCGEGDEHLCATAFAHLEPEAFVYFGTRDLDPGEQDWIATNGVPVANTAIELVQQLRMRGRSIVAIHLDLDVLDPAAFGHVSYPTPHGRSVGEIAAALQAISNGFSIVGATIAECTAAAGVELQPIEPLLRWWVETSGVQCR